MGFDTVSSTVCDGLQIGSRAEMPTVAGEDSYPSRIIGFEALEGLEEVLGSVAIDGVSDVWTVERDGDHGSHAHRLNGTHLRVMGRVGSMRSPEKGGNL